MSAGADRVVRAWIEPGPEPHIHWRAQERLRHEWPVLAAAIEELVERAGAPGCLTHGCVLRVHTDGRHLIIRTSGIARVCICDDDECAGECARSVRVEFNQCPGGYGPPRAADPGA